MTCVDICGMAVMGVTKCCLDWRSIPQRGTHSRYSKAFQKSIPCLPQFVFFNPIWWNFFLTQQLWPCHLPHTSMVTSLDCLTSTISKLIHNFNFHCPNHLTFYLITLSILTQTSKKMFYMMCMSLLSACSLCTICLPGVQRPEKGIKSQSCRWLSAVMWVLGNRSKSSGYQPLRHHSSPSNLYCTEKQNYLFACLSIFETDSYHVTLVDLELTM